LTALYSSLQLRIEFADATLDTLELDGSKLAAEQTKARAREVQNAITALENYLATIGNGNLWIPYFKVDALKSALQTDPEGAATVDAASQTVAVLQGRDSHLDDQQKSFTHRPQFDRLSTAASQLVAAAAWKNAPQAIDKLRTELKAFNDALDTYLSTGEKASEVRHAFGRVRFASADGGSRLASTLQKRLFNYNLRVVANEDFLNKLMSQTRREVGPVVDFIMGANVSGCQVTDTVVSVNLKPSSTTARFDLNLQGNIHSNTQGVTPQATVLTEGNHTFIASKEVNFDGLNFSTLPATISVQPHNTTRGISTRVSGVPILGRIANRIAAGQVEARGPEAAAIAESRVRDGVLPRFNSEVDSSFAKEGAKLNTEVFGGLRAAGVFPDTYSYQTTDRLLKVNARVMSEDQIGADIPENAMITSSGAVALLHESLMNNSIDHMGLAGQTLTEPELRGKIEEFISKMTNRPFKIDAPPPAEGDEKGPNAIIFAKTDPVRVRIQDGVLTLIIRAGFKQEGKEDIPMREVTVPITFTLQGHQILMQTGNIIVTAAEGEGGGISINAVVRKKVQFSLPDRTVDADIVVKGPEKTATVHVTRIMLIDGWASVSID
jgi:hypothetical protein